MNTSLKNEVRIGNIVEAFGWETIAGINSDSFRFKSGNGSTHTMPRAIEVSNAMLKEKCSFDDYKHGGVFLQVDYYKPEKITRSIQYAAGSLYLIEQWGDNASVSTILWNKDLRGPLSLHMLQNIFFDLSGDQLKIAI